MDNLKIKVERTFKNGKKLIAVTREVTTYFTLADAEGEPEVQEKQTVDNLEAKTWNGLPQEFWDKVNSIIKERVIDE